MPPSGQHRAGHVSATPERRTSLGGTAIRLRVAEAGDLADLAVAVAGGDQAEGTALGGLQGGEAYAGVVDELDQLLGPASPQGIDSAAKLRPAEFGAASWLARR